MRSMAEALQMLFAQSHDSGVNGERLQQAGGCRRSAHWAVLTARRQTSQVVRLEAIQDWLATIMW